MYKTALHKISLLLLVFVILAISALVYHQYVFFILICIAAIIVGKIWHRKVGEELIIFRLKQNQNRMQLQKINSEFGKSGGKSLSSLNNRGIIRIENDEVYLINPDYIGTFDKKL